MRKLLEWWVNLEWKLMTDAERFNIEETLKKTLDYYLKLRKNKK